MPQPARKHKETKSQATQAFGACVSFTDSQTYTDTHTDTNTQVHTGAHTGAHTMPPTPSRSHTPRGIAAATTAATDSGTASSTATHLLQLPFQRLKLRQLLLLLPHAGHDVRRGKRVVHHGPPRIAQRPRWCHRAVHKVRRYWITGRWVQHSRIHPCSAAASPRAVLLVTHVVRHGSTKPRERLRVVGGAVRGRCGRFRGAHTLCGGVGTATRRSAASVGRGASADDCAGREGDGTRL